MINFVVSLFLGMFPEVLYFTLFLVFTKDIKQNRIKLFLLLALGYIVLIMLCRYQIMFYLAYIVYSYLILRKFYNGKIIDLFVYSLAFCYISLISLILCLFLDNYIVAYVLDRVLLFIPFVFHRQLRNLYLSYKYLWDRHKDNKIKSITIRNSSLVMINIMIVAFDILAVLSLEFYKTL